MNPRVNKVIARSSKRKQKLYEKYIKNVPPKKNKKYINKIYKK